MKIKELENMAREMVGDNKRPNLFFVCAGHRGVVAVTRDFEPAYALWQSFPMADLPTLEDRHIGCICSIEPENEDGTGHLQIIDNAQMFNLV